MTIERERERVNLVEMKFTPGNINNLVYRVGIETIVHCQFNINKQAGGGGLTDLHCITHSGHSDKKQDHSR